MQMHLAENIRRHRKERSLTQEQLAEVLGVTVGAVYKWEAKLSVPELPMIVEMADFFDTSVDALLAYEVKDNRLEATEARLWQCHRDKDRNGLAEVEKALKKYPNAFGIAFAGATLYHGIGMEAQDGALLRRALELYEKARQLLPQNRDATISEQTLCGSISQVYFALNEKEKALALTKSQNAGDLYSAVIGVMLALEVNRTEEAVPFLSRALMKTFNEIIYISLGLAGVYRARRDDDNGKAILIWAMQALRGLKQGANPDYVDKLCAVYGTYLAGFQIDAGETGDAAKSLRQAVMLARGFDAAPDYSLRSIRFIGDDGRTGAAYDVLGATAIEAVENALRDIDNAQLWALYRKGVE